MKVISKKTPTPNQAPANLAIRRMDPAPNHPTVRSLRNPRSPVIRDERGQDGRDG